MKTLDHLFRDGRNTGPYSGLTRYFFLSGLALAGFLAYTALVSFIAQWMGNDTLAIGTPAELGPGGIALIVGLIGFLWLFMTGFAARGAALRERDRRIAALEARLNVKSKC